MLLNNHWRNQRGNFKKYLEMNENKSTTVKNLWDATKASHKREGSVRFGSIAQSCPTLWPHGLQHVRPPCPSPSPRVYSNSCPSSRWCHPIISSCRPLLLLPSIFPSIRVFSNDSVLRIRWPKYWSFSFSISPFKQYSGLISFRMHWLDLLAVQGTLKSLLQHHSSNASILRRSALFIVQLSHPYMTNGKTIALTRWTFVGKVMSLLFNMLSRLVIYRIMYTVLENNLLDFKISLNFWKVSSVNQM